MKQKKFYYTVGDIGIRPYNENDVDALYQAARESIKNNFPFMPWCHPDYSMEDTKDFVLSRQQAWDDKEAYSFIIFNTKSEKFLGGIGINFLNWEHRFANFGYWVRQSELGKGIAVEACRLAVEFSFKELNLKRLEIVTAIENVASQRVAEKLGAIKEGIAHNRLHLHGKSVDAYMYAIVNK